LTAFGEEKLSHKGADVYLQCLLGMGDEIFQGTSAVKPLVFQKRAAERCKHEENLFRQSMTLEAMEKVIARRKFLNEGEAAVLKEAQDYAVSGLQRSVVVLYAREFEKRHHGMMPCQLSALPSSEDQTKQYICAIRE
jgi:hypothetical protein